MTNNNLSRRKFLSQGAMVALAFTALQRAILGGTEERVADFLVKDPEKIIDLPEGFSYHAFSKSGEEMSDGLLVPGKHDGMGAFRGSDGKTILVRNHELDNGATSLSAFGKKNEFLNKINREFMYDAGRGTKPSLGGTTTLVYDTRTKTLEKHFLSLAGTIRNCAGGITPWGSWITCEEDTSQPNSSGQDSDDPLEKHHGFNFEVPAGEEIELRKAIPLKAMGRFRHEAVAVDPHTGIVYQTEDHSDGLFYRFIPKVRGQLARGGQLQALRILGSARTDTRNFSRSVIQQGQVLKVEWVNIHDVEAPDDDLRFQGYYESGAARFARGEGIWYGDNSVYFACTNGGTKRKGQIWKYTPSPYEGRSGEKREPGRLELFIEPNNGSLVENCDNVTIAPWGDLIVCEDGKSPQYLLGITPSGQIYKIGRTKLSEFAGACFGPDNNTLFVNIMDPGITLAIQGPWAEFRRQSLVS